METENYTGLLDLWRVCANAGSWSEAVEISAIRLETKREGPDREPGRIGLDAFRAPLQSIALFLWRLAPLPERFGRASFRRTRWTGKTLGC